MTISLPKIEHNIIKITIPSQKKEFNFRPFLVKEEKILLMAKESGVVADSLQAIKQIVNNCLLDDFNVNDMALFDLEYVFLKLRQHSVDNICPVSFIDNEDEKVYNFDIDLNSIEVEFPKDSNNIIKISDKMGIVLKYPSASLYDDKEYLNLKKDQLYELIVRCVDKIYNEDEMYNAKDYTYGDISKFLDELNNKTFMKIQNFLSNLPSIKHEIKYKNEKGKERTIVLKTLSDFFTLQ